MVIFLTLVAVILGTAAVLLLVAPEAGASPCEHRSSRHISEHGGLAADSAWHVAHGQLPTCGQEASRQRAEDGSRKSEERDRKSRFCRKRWWC